MKVSVLYFASLREAVGTSKEILDLPSTVMHAADLVVYLGQRGAHWKQALQLEKGLRCAINQDVVAFTAILSEGDEIALFPPVTGG